MQNMRHPSEQYSEFSEFSHVEVPEDVVKSRKRKKMIFRLANQVHLLPFYRNKKKCCDRLDSACHFLLLFGFVALLIADVLSQERIESSALKSVALGYGEVKSGCTPLTGWTIQSNCSECDESRWLYVREAKTCNQCKPGFYGFRCESTCSDCSGAGNCRDGVYGDGKCQCNFIYRLFQTSHGYHECSFNFLELLWPISFVSFLVLLLLFLIILSRRGFSLSALKNPWFPTRIFFVEAGVEIYGASFVLLYMMMVLPLFVLFITVSIFPSTTIPGGRKFLTMGLIQMAFALVSFFGTSFLSAITSHDLEQVSKALELWDASGELSSLQMAQIIDGEDVELLGHVASGGFGAVFKARWKVLPGTVVAVKKFFPELENIDENGEDKVTILDEREVQVMARLRHRRLVTFLGAGVLPDGSKFMMSEWCPGGDLCDRLRSAGTLLTWEFRLQCARDVAEGMAYLHGCDFLHLDLKSSNVLLDVEGRCKIADFGLSRKWAHRRRSATSVGEESGVEVDDDRGAVGSIPWMPPESLAALGGVARRVTYSVATDVYAFGILMCEILTCEEPYHDIGAISRVVAEVVGNDLRPTVSAAALQLSPPGYADLMRLCWSRSAPARPGMAEVYSRLMLLLAENHTRGDLKSGSTTFRRQILEDTTHDGKERTEETKYRCEQRRDIEGDGQESYSTSEIHDNKSLLQSEQHDSITVVPETQLLKDYRTYILYKDDHKWADGCEKCGLALVICCIICLQCIQVVFVADAPNEVLIEPNRVSHQSVVARGCTPFTGWTVDSGCQECDKTRWKHDANSNSCNACQDGQWGIYCNNTCDDCHGTCRDGIHGDGVCVCSLYSRMILSLRPFPKFVYGRPKCSYPDESKALFYFVVVILWIFATIFVGTCYAISRKKLCNCTSNIRQTCKQYAIRWKVCPSRAFLQLIALEMFGVPQIFVTVCGGLLPIFLCTHAVLIQPSYWFPLKIEYDDQGLGLYISGHVFVWYFWFLGGLMYGMIFYGLLAKIVISRLKSAALLADANAARQDISRLQSGQVVDGEDVELLGHVASGGFGAVFKARWKVLPGTVVAVKKFFPELENIDENGEDKVTILDEREVQVMARLRHRRLVTFLGAGVLPDGSKFMMSEWCPGGDLCDRLRSAGTLLTWEFRLQCARDVAEGMAYLHGCDFLHLDLKSSNVLLDVEGRCKIADFGLSRKWAHRRRSATSVGEESGVEVDDDRGAVGSIPWMPPESLAALGGVARRVTYSVATDVYAFGILMCEILTCEEPYHDIGAISRVVAEVVGNDLRPTVSAAALQLSPPGYADLMRLCWSRSAPARPGMAEVYSQLKLMSLNRQ